MEYDASLLEPPKPIDDPKEEHTQEIIEKPSNELQTTTTTNINEEYHDAILENQQALERIADMGLEVLESAKEMSINVGKSSDVESFSILMKANIDLHDKIVAIKEKRLKKAEPKVDSQATTKNVQNNNIIIRSARDLNALLKNMAKEESDSKNPKTIIEQESSSKQ